MTVVDIWVNALSGQAAQAYLGGTAVRLLKLG